MSRSRYQRPARLRAQNSRLLIVSEGLVTEQEYIDAVKRQRTIRSADFTFMPPGPTSPLQIVARALELRDNAKKTDPYDQVWCIFDTEAKVNQKHRPGLVEALRRATDTGINVALSNPCFEIWLLLHQQLVTANTTSESAQKKCKKLKLAINKHLPDADRIVSHLATACENAQKLELRHDANCVVTPSDRNPSSTMFRLIEAIQTLFPQQR